MATTTDINTLKINYLTQAQYDAALANNEINENELYFTPEEILALVATTGNYNDLNNKPTIPTVPSNIVNTITTTAGAHTAITNQTGAVSFSVPTKTSDLTNDSGFVTSSITKQATTVTLTSFGWNNNSQTVIVNGVTTNSDIIIVPSSSTAEAYSAANIMGVSQATNSITFECKETPDSDVGVDLLIFT